MTTTARAADRRLDAAVLGGGLLLGLACLLLAATGASRAIAGFCLPLAVALAVVGGLGVAGRAVPRWVHVALAVVAVALLAFGLATLVYALSSQNTSA